MNQTLPGSADLLSAPVAQLSDSTVLLYDREGTILSWHQPGTERSNFALADFIGKSLEQIISSKWSRFSGGVDLDLKNTSGEFTGLLRVLQNASWHNTSVVASRALISALEHSNVLIRTWNGVLEYWTEGCERLYGFSAQEATGQVLHRLLQTEYPVPIEQLHEELMRDGVWRGELKQISKTGKPVFVSAHLVKLETSPGQLPMVVGTHSDITYRLEMQHELESANSRLKLMAEELERSNEELEEFARIASHDLSAPITSTRWLVEVLTSRHGKQLDSDGQRALAQVAISLERMSDLVEAVLTHAKVGKSPIASLEEADTELALEVAKENLRRDVMTTGARIRCDHLPPLLVGQQPLTQLFQNLLSNAIKYRRPDAAPDIHVFAEQSGALWRVCVQDNGMGVEPEWFERIFLPMQRRHSSKIAGSGIGLATCRKIVNRAGGRIWVESEVGVGSRFFFTLPGMASS